MEIMKTQDSIFANRPAFDVAKKILYGPKDVGFSPYGEYWRQAKKICVLHLLSNKKVESLRQIREEEVVHVVDMIRRMQSSKGPVNMSEIMITYAYDIACRAVLGKKYSGEEEENKVWKLTRESSALFGAFNVRDFFPGLGWLNWLTGMDAKVERHFQEWDGFLNQVIQQHQEGNNDLLNTLFSIQKDETNGFELGMDEIKGILMDMLGGGTETSFVVMEWAMAELVKSPEKMNRAQEEIRRIVSEKKTVKVIREEDTYRMSYLKAVIKEVLRLHPPSPLLMPRESMEETRIQGYNIPAKTRVIINGWALGRDPELWKMADEFQPERFLSDNEVDFKGHDFHYIPFGSGRRICPGIGFALSSIELLLANLLYWFDWKLPGEKQPQELDMSEASGLTVCMKNQLLLHAALHQE
ncbi:hypothetical protein J5N97_019041 [Dioscorea zingiberensis]|uniref:Cytochrome P450 n=1 Tax=Dioscorea zingiberensis TaxID=325984 RepID=A0A9D5CE92_9LILI|nr:hypothetical protein J5N97_019041 [Dioscorea zingiberensis]